MQAPRIPEDPIGHFEDCSTVLAQCLARLVATGAVSPELMPRTTEYVEAVKRFGEALVMLAVWMQPDRPQPTPPLP